MSSSAEKRKLLLEVIDEWRRRSFIVHRSSFLVPYPYPHANPPSLSHVPISQE